jgi:hypothetical protein
MKCNICGEEVEYCDYCNSLFKKEDVVYCGSEIGREHLCVDCMTYSEGMIV